MGTRLTCLETGRAWDSAVAAARDTGVPLRSVFHSLGTGAAARGMHFRRMDGTTPAPAPPGPGGARRVRRVSDGREWPSASEAARCLGCTRQAMSAAARNGRPMADGETYEFVDGPGAGGGRP